MIRILQKRVAGSLRVQCSRMVSNRATDSPAFDEDSEVDFKKQTEKCLNKVTLIGRVGREPEQRGNTENPCLTFPLATNKTYTKADGERMMKTEWHRVVVFRPGLRDNVASRIEKGDRLYLEGSLSYTKYSDADNRTNNIVSIIAEDIMFLGRRMNRTHDKEDIA
uniref:Single-stranded DNA-binding protein n=1 Tax=Arion vulgaris TaxID=1028688 RepID=A0A0B7BQE9_9EUPU